MSKFYVLNNPEDQASRDFVDSLVDEVGIAAVFDWYRPEDMELWVAHGGTLNITAFPAVIFDRPELDQLYTGTRDDGVVVTSRRIFLADQEVVNLPDHMDHVRTIAGVAEALAAVTWLEAVAKAKGTTVSERNVEAAKVEDVLSVVIDRLDGAELPMTVPVLDRFDMAAGGSVIDWRDAGTERMPVVNRPDHAVVEPRLPVL